MVKKIEVNTPDPVPSEKVGTEGPIIYRVQEHPYSRMFYLKNRDPANYVLSKDFFFWSIVSLYLFLIWYYVLIFKNYDFLNQGTTLNNEGGLVWYFSLVSAVCLFFVVVYGYYQKMKNVYPLLGFGFSLLLTSMGLLIFNFRSNEVDRGYENDPVQIAYTFLLLYAFISFFLI